MDLEEPVSIDQSGAWATCFNSLSGWCVSHLVPVPVERGYLLFFLHTATWRLDLDDTMAKQSPELTPSRRDALRRAQLREPSCSHQR